MYFVLTSSILLLNANHIHICFSDAFNWKQNRKKRRIIVFYVSSMLYLILMYHDQQQQKKKKRMKIERQNTTRNEIGLILMRPMLQIGYYAVNAIRTAYTVSCKTIQTMRDGCANACIVYVMCVCACLAEEKTSHRARSMSQEITDYSIDYNRKFNRNSMPYHCV